jgi:hypothetical protein
MAGTAPSPQHPATTPGNASVATVRVPQPSLQRRQAMMYVARGEEDRG